LFSRLVDRVSGRKPYKGVGFLFTNLLDQNNTQTKDVLSTTKFIDSLNKLESVI